MLRRFIFCSVTVQYVHLCCVIAKIREAITAVARIG